MPALALSLIFFSALFVLRGGPAPQLNMSADRHTQKREISRCIQISLLAWPLWEKTQKSLLKFLISGGFSCIRPYSGRFYAEQVFASSADGSSSSSSRLQLTGGEK